MPENANDERSNIKHLLLNNSAGAAHISSHSNLYGAAADSRIWAGPLVLCHQYGPWQAESESGAACASAQLFWVFVVPSKVSFYPLLLLPVPCASGQPGIVGWGGACKMSAACIFSPYHLAPGSQPLSHGPC